MRKFPVVLAVSVAGFALLVPSLTQAHFQLMSPQNWFTQTTDGSPQKAAPCGSEATTPATTATKMVTTVQPGESVPVQVYVTVGHPGWFRVSLKQGASATQTTSSLPDPPTLSASGAQQCTPAFIDNPVWSPTQPVLADKLGLPAGSTSTTTQQPTGTTKTFNVTIPSTATCTTASPCTLQVLMFMTDHTSGNCNYHHCADIAIQTGATGAGGHGGGAAGSSGAKGGAAGSSSNATGGTTASGGAPGAGGGAGEAAGTGGTPSTGSGGSVATGGTLGSGGTVGSGGRNASGGATGSAGASAPDNSSSGCSYGPGGTTASKLGLGIVLLLAVAAARRRLRARGR
ncbi:MAG: SCE4755 family polysaccharide monooxygenase-like protein [Polyangia bacterium]|jgi:hypothetical protein